MFLSKVIGPIALRQMPNLEFILHTHCDFAKRELFTIHSDLRLLISHPRNSCLSLFLIDLEHLKPFLKLTSWDD